MNRLVEEEKKEEKLINFKRRKGVRLGGSAWRSD